MQSPITATFQKEGLEESCSSAFYSEEGNNHLNESSFSSLNEETPTLIPKRTSNIYTNNNTNEFQLHYNDINKI